MAKLHFNPRDFKGYNDAVVFHEVMWEYDAENRVDAQYDRSSLVECMKKMIKMRIEKQEGGPILLCGGYVFRNGPNNTNWTFSPRESHSAIHYSGKYGSERSDNASYFEKMLQVRESYRREHDVVLVLDHIMTMQEYKHGNFCPYSFICSKKGVISESPLYKEDEEVVARLVIPEMYRG